MFLQTTIFIFFKEGFVLQHLKSLSWQSKNFTEKF